MTTTTFYYLCLLGLQAILTMFCFTFQVEQNPLVGFIAIAVAVICSGFAGRICTGFCRSDYVLIIVGFWPLNANMQKHLSAK